MKIFPAIADYVSPFAQYGTLVADYDPSRGLTYDGSDRIELWSNSVQNQLQWDASQATAGKKPLYQATGGPTAGPAVLFANARNDFLASISFTATEPLSLIFYAKAVSEVAGQTLSDGLTGDTRRLQELGDLMAFIRNAQVGTVSFTVGAWHKVAIVLNGASSFLRVDGNSVTKDYGTTAASGIVIGCNGTAGGLSWDGPIARGLVYSGALADATVTTIFGAL